MATYTDPNLPDVNNKRYKWNPITQSYDPAEDLSGVGTYDPWNTQYSGAEGGAISKLADIVKYGGYSPETKKAMLASGMIPINQQTTADKTAATNSDYARGLGQSGVLSRDLSSVNTNRQNALTELTGGIEKQSAEAVLPAISAIQTGAQQQMTSQAQAESLKADVAKTRATLKTNLHMSDQDYDAAMTKLGDARYQSDADRAVTIANMKNQFNLDEEKMAMLEKQFEAESNASFWSSLFGGVTGMAGTALGGGGLAALLKALHLE